MKKYFLLSLILFACAGNDYLVMTNDDISHPILNLEVVEIPSEGTVVWITGDAEIKKKDNNEYVPIGIETIIGENDIIWLKKEAKVKIVFEDGSYIVNDSKAKDGFITFNIAKTGNLPK